MVEPNKGEERVSSSFFSMILDILYSFPMCSVIYDLSKRKFI